MKVAPSILTADFINLKDELNSIETADFIHLDIMDGHFVPNMSFGPDISKGISKHTKLPLDIHLMVTNPYKWIDRFSFENTRYITIHIESRNIIKSMVEIKKRGIGLGLSIKPKTDLERIMPYIYDLDLILVMTVEPGFGGQSFIPEMMEKVKELVRLRQEKNLRFDIEVDGGINDETIEICKQSGVDIVVAGSYLFNMSDRKKGIESLR